LATEAARIFINVDTNARKATGQLNQLDRSVGKNEKSTKKLAGSFLSKAGLAAGIAAATVAAAKLSSQLIAAASDAEETSNKFNVTFSSISDSAQETAQNLADNFGLSSKASQQLLADTGDLLSGFGFTQESALDLSTQVNELAVDLASFTNFSGGAEGASQALTKALLGERESIKSLGIAITEADIKRLAEDKGITGELDRQTKALLTLELATKQSKNAIGDFERSAGTLVQVQKEASAEFDDLAVNLGERLKPAAIAVTEAFGNLAGNINDALNAADERSQRRISELNASFEDLVSSFDGTEESLEKIQDRFPGVTRGIISAANETGNYVSALNEVEKAQGKLQRIDFLQQFGGAESDIIAVDRAINSLNLELLDLSGKEATGNWWEDDTRPAVERAQKAFDILNEQAAITSSSIELTSDSFDRLVSLIEAGDEQGIENLLNSFIGTNTEVEELRKQLADIQSGSNISELNGDVDDAAKSWVNYKEDALNALDKVFTGIEKEASIADALGEDFDVVEQKSDAIRKTITDLLNIPADQIDEAFTLDDNTIKDLLRQLQSLNIGADVWLPGPQEVRAATQYIQGAYEDIGDSAEEAGEKAKVSIEDAFDAFEDFNNQIGGVGIDTAEALGISFTTTLGDIASAFGPVGMAASAVIDAWADAFQQQERFREEIPQLSEDINRQIDEILLNQRKDALDRLYDAEIANIKAIEEARIQAFLSTLSEEEVQALKTAGVIEETELERIQREKQEAIEAGDDETLAQLENEEKIAQIRADALAKQEQAEREYRNKVAQWEYEKAVFDKDARMAEAEAKKQSALADLPWWAPKGKREEVAGIYDGLISTIEGISIPSPPSFQFGGSFEVPPGNAMDGGLIRVNQGERVDVSPVRSGGGMRQPINIMVDRKVLAKTVVDLTNSGEGGVLNSRVIR
jgi:hypothetical protein